MTALDKTRAIGLGLGQGVLRQAHDPDPTCTKMSILYRRAGRASLSIERVVGAGFGRIGGRPRTCFARTGAAATVSILRSRVRLVCSTFVLIGFTCPAITVATVILWALDRVRGRALGWLGPGSPKSLGGGDIKLFYYFVEIEGSIRGAPFTTPCPN